MKKKVFITGADGFIGSHLVEKFLSQNISVKALVQYNSFNNYGWLDHLSNKSIKNLEIIFGDIRNYEFIKKSTIECNTIIHLAALIGIPYSYENPESYLDTNIYGTLNVLEATKNNKIKKLIVTSTSEVYGTAKKIPIKENHPLQPQSPYSATKIAADQLCLAYFNSFNTPVSIIRPFNTFGPRQSARAVIPAIIIQALQNKEIKLGLTTPTRDFNFVEDIVNGFYLAFKTKKNINGEVINLGTGFEISIRDIIGLILKHTSKKNLKITKDKSRTRPLKSEVHRLIADNTRAKKILNWKPVYGNKQGLEEALIKTIDWFSKKENLEKYKSQIYNK